MTGLVDVPSGTEYPALPDKRSSRSFACRSLYVRSAGTSGRSSVCCLAPPLRRLLPPCGSPGRSNAGSPDASSPPRSPAESAELPELLASSEPWCDSKCAGAGTKKPPPGFGTDEAFDVDE